MPLRLRILSDIHTDYYPQAPLPRCGEADFTLLAGDWANGDFLLRQGFVGLEPDGPLYGVLGNHEWHGLDMHEDRPALLAAATAEGLRLLEREVVELDGWTLLGCSLWTDFALEGDAFTAAQQAQTALSDFSNIRLNGRVLQPRDAIAFCRGDMAWLDAGLSRCEPARTIVMTHFGPHPQSVHPLYDNPGSRPLNPYFVSDTGLIEKHQPALWIHGHTHQRLDYRVGRTRVICNPRGYPGEPQAAAFDAGLVLELSAER